MSISVYVHIPFCLQKCRYCDFVSYAGADSMHQSYIAALCQEIAGRGGIFATEGVTVSSIFVGGGTPTCLSAECLRELFTCLNRNLCIEPAAEISVEANPGTLDQRKLSVLSDAGVNRLSFGVQSFDDTLLKVLGRVHNAAEAERAVRLARQYDISNINIDVMHGLPGQSLALYRKSLEAAVSLGVEHISAYSLIVEEDTPLARQLASGELSLPDPDVDAAMFECTHDYLSSQGYEHYEISNYAKPGRRCAHNLRYWRYQPYIGFGAAACSFDTRNRWTNTSDVSDYIEAMSNGSVPIAEREELSLPTSMGEYVFLALRTMDGLSYADFEERFSTDFCAYYRRVLTNLTNEGLIDYTNEGIRLTHRGLLFGNQVFAAFLPD